MRRRRIYNIETNRDKERESSERDAQTTMLQDKDLRRSVIMSEVQTMIKLGYQLNWRATLFIDKQCYQDYSHLRRSVITSGGVLSPHEVRKMTKLDSKLFIS